MLPPLPGAAPLRGLPPVAVCPPGADGTPLGIQTHIGTRVAQSGLSQAGSTNLDSLEHSKAQCPFHVVIPSARGTGPVGSLPLGGYFAI